MTAWHSSMGDDHDRQQGERQPDSHRGGRDAACLLQQGSIDYPHLQGGPGGQQAEEEAAGRQVDGCRGARPLPAWLATSKKTQSLHMMMRVICCGHFFVVVGDDLLLLQATSEPGRQTDS